MSFSVDHVYGYGFQVDFGDEKFDEKKFFKFLKDHKETISQFYDGERIIEFIEQDKLDLDEFCEKFAERESIENYGYNAAQNIIADIMTKETDVRFSFQLDMETDNTFIMFTECMPWLLNRVEKNLTEDELHNLCVMYMRDAGIPAEEQYAGELIGMQKVEYFG